MGERKKEERKRKKKGRKGRKEERKYFSREEARRRRLAECGQRKTLPIYSDHENFSVAREEVAMGESRSVSVALLDLVDLFPFTSEYPIYIPLVRG